MITFKTFLKNVSSATLKLININEKAGIKKQKQDVLHGMLLALINDGKKFLPLWKYFFHILLL